MLTYILGVISGAALPVQTSINSTLRKKLTSPFLSSLISVSSGFICIALILLLSGIGFGVPAGASEQPVWLWSGGLFGITLVTLNILVMRAIGSVETVIFGVLGQILTGLFIDHFGWFMAAVIRITPFRLLGAVLVTGGIIAASIEGRSANSAGQRAEKKAVSTSMSTGRRMIYRLLGIVSGMAIGIQVAVNGSLGSFLGSPYKATFVSFAGSTFCAILLCLVLKAFGKLHEPGDGSAIKGRWWMYTGGLLGIFCVIVNVLLANALGTGLAVIVSLIGQVAGGIVIDLTGFLGAEIKPLTIRKAAGLIIMIIGAAIIRLM